MSWVLFACATGNGGPIGTLLSWRAFGPVSRINYSAYLYHIMIILLIVANLRDGVLYSDFLFATLYCGVLVISYGVAFLATLWFESPIVNLEKLAFG